MTDRVGSMTDEISEMTLRFPVRMGTMEEARNGLFIPRAREPTSRSR